MGGVSKTFAKVHKKVRKYDPTAKLMRKTFGDKAWDQAHFLGSSAVKQVDAAEAAKADAASAADAAEKIRIRQATDLANLDDEENRRIKKILSGSRGTRNYRGGPMFRGRASNTAGGGGAPRTAAGGSSSAASASAFRTGGARGGLSRPGSASLL